MRKIPAIHVTFELNGPIEIPVNYHHLIQSFIYSLLPSQDALYLHDVGYEYQNRIFKLFTFSNIQCDQIKYDKNTKNLVFYDKIQISISSILPEFIQKITNTLIHHDHFVLHRSKMRVGKIGFDENIAFSNCITVKALSPITVYSTYERRDGSKITHYFSPWDRVFEHLIEENFARKYQAFTGKSIEKKELIKVRPVRVTRKDKKVTNYKSTWITGWTGVYELEGEAEHLTFLLNTGLGSKNSIGFGFIRLLNKGVQENDKNNI